MKANNQPENTKTLKKESMFCILLLVFNGEKGAVGV